MNEMFESLQFNNEKRNIPTTPSLISRPSHKIFEPFFFISRDHSRLERSTNFCFRQTFSHHFLKIDVVVNFIKNLWRQGRQAHFVGFVKMPLVLRWEINSKKFFRVHPVRETMLETLVSLERDRGKWTISLSRLWLYLERRGLTVRL